MRKYSSQWKTLMAAAGYFPTKNAPPLPSRTLFPHPDFPAPKKVPASNLRGVHSKLAVETLSANSPTLKKIKEEEELKRQKEQAEAPPDDEEKFYQYLYEKLQYQKWEEEQRESNAAFRYAHLLKEREKDADQSQGGSAYDSLRRGQERRYNAWTQNVNAMRDARVQRGELNIRRGYGHSDYSTGVNSCSLIPNYPSNVTYSSNDNPEKPSKMNDKYFGRQTGNDVFDSQVKCKDVKDVIDEAVEFRKALRGSYDPKGGLKIALGEGKVPLYGSAGGIGGESLAWARDVSKDPVTKREGFLTVKEKDRIIDNKDKIDVLLNTREVPDLKNFRGTDAKKEKVLELDRIAKKRGTLILEGEREFDKFKEFERRRIRGHEDAPPATYANSQGSMARNLPEFMPSLTKSKLPENTKSMVGGELIRDAGFNMVHPMKYGHFFRLGETEDDPWPLKTFSKPLGASDIEKRFPIAPVANIY
eukprot:GDKJ01014898.1.p1 GENE.GDKJ01014898.1~~GDKJ01014898.1.p1  ORF type:complete len:485 (-),score=102.80 GDKJ01014898.1:36-1457(-)